MQQRESPSSYYKRTPPDPGKMQKLISEPHCDQAIPADQKRAPTGDEICLFASLVCTIASIRVAMPKNWHEHHEALFQQALPLIRRPSIDWTRCPFDYDLSALVGTFDSPDGASFGALNRELKRLDEAGVPLFHIGLVCGALWVEENQRLSAP